MSKRRELFYLINFIIFAFAIAGFCWQSFGVDKSQAANNAVLISQIMIGQESAANNEFIELYNTTGQDIDLSGFSLKKKTQTGTSESSLVSAAKFSGIIPAYGFFLVAHTGYKDASSADLAYSSAAYFISSNNTITLYDNNGILADRVGYGAASSYEGQTATEPVASQSIKRKVADSIMVDSDNNSADFELDSAPSPRNSQSPKLITIPSGNDTATSSEPIVQPGQEQLAATSGDLSLIQPSYGLGQVLINEFVSDPADGEVEWIELCNAANREIDLTGWTVEEGSGAKTNINGRLKFNTERYATIEKPNGNLNNPGDIIVLRDSGGTLIDQVSYGNWADGNLSDNAPAAADPLSVARIIDCRSSFNNSLDFSLTAKTTKGSANIILTDPEESAGTESGHKYDYSEDIFLSEIYPDPSGQDQTEEFFELYNNGASDINLAGWRITDDTGTKIALEKISTSTIIKAGSLLAFYRPQTKIALNNGGDSLKLYRPQEEKIFRSIKYKAAEEGQSYNLDIDCLKSGQAVCAWEWSKTITPGQANVLGAKNQAPDVDFSFPAVSLLNQPINFKSGDTIDPDGDKLTFNWDFGDGMKNSLANPTHTYLKEGGYKVVLTASDGQNQGKKEKTIKITRNINVTATSTIPAGAVSDGRVIFSEIMPNPIGNDAELEWIELKSENQTSLDLSGWKIEAVGSNKFFTFQKSLNFDPGDYYLLERSASGIALNNQGMILQLFDDESDLIDKVEYGPAAEGESYARGENGKWFWTTRVTPGEKNTIALASSEKTSPPAQVKGLRLPAKQANIEYIETSLEKIRDLEVGDQVRVRGIVAVEPGILGTQIFYIVGSPGIQVYNYKKDFPRLKVGDYLEITGELAESSGELRIKTTGKENFKVLGKKEKPMPQSAGCDKINEESIGQMIKITGTVTDRKSSTVYLDDGSDEAMVYIKSATGIDAKAFTAGAEYAIVGIVGRTTSGVRLLPRSTDDISLLNPAQGETPIAATQVLGEVPAGDNWEVAARDKQQEARKHYLLVIVISCAVLAGWAVKKYHKP